MSQYRSGSSSGSQPQRRQGVPGGAILLSALILGICILIAGINIGSSVKKLNETISGTTFSSTYSSPDNLQINTAAQRKYLTQNEAAEYLNVSAGVISDAIADGKIDEYIITSDGYSISVESLDDYFADEAYAIQTKKNSSDN